MPKCKSQLRAVSSPRRWHSPTAVPTPVLAPLPTPSLPLSPWTRNGTCCLQAPRAACDCPSTGSSRGAGSANTPKEPGCVAGAGRDRQGAITHLHPTELPGEPGVLKKDPASPFHFPAENIWSAWHLCCSKYSRASCSRARCHRDRWVRAQAAKRPCISIKCVC